MASGTATMTASLDPLGRIAQDAHCTSCGYNLRSLLPEQTCPECNQPVGESLRGDLLQFSNPAWLATLASGMGWILVGSILLLALHVCRGTFWQWVGATWPLTLGVMPSGGFFCSGLLSLVGAWKVTSPEPRLQDTQPGITVRTAARVLVAVGFALTWTTTMAQAVSPLPVSMFSLLDGAKAMHAVGWICLCIHLARLGHRLPAPGLARFTGVVCAIGAVVASLSHFVGIVNLWRVWILGGVARTGTGMFLGWPCAIMIWHGISRTSVILTLIWAAIYHRRLRKMLQMIG